MEVSSFQRVLCYVHVHAGFNGVESGPEDVSLLERCSLLGSLHTVREAKLRY